MQLTPNKKDNFAFAGDLRQLEQFLASGDKRKLIVGGSLLVGSLEPMKAPASLVAQAPRKVDAGFMGASKSDSKLYLLLDKQALELLVKHKTKPGFFVDALLRFGGKLKGNDEYCVLGALELSDATQVVALRFKKQVLVGYSEYQIAHSNSNTYEADLHLLTERLAQQVPVANTYWAGPLRAPKLQIYKQTQAQPWAAAPAQQLTLSGRPSFLRRHGVALGVVALTAVGYAGTMYVPYQRYLTAQQEMAVESATLKGQSAFDSERLSVLRSRQAFFESQARSAARYEQFMETLAAFAQEPSVSLRDATLNAPVDSARGRRMGKPADYEILVEVDKHAEVSALDQAKPLLASLSQRIGAGVRLSAAGDGYVDVTTSKGGARRVYRIQGDFKNVQ